MTDRHVNGNDLRGFSRLAVDATAGLVDLVEEMHATILARPPLGTKPDDGRTSGITGLVYESIRGVTRLVGGSLDALLAQLVPMLEGGGSTQEREAVLAALNGVIGDYLVATGNPLAMRMRLGQVKGEGSRLAVFVHGLCMNDLQWARDGKEPGPALARELGHATVHVRYNTGLHISENGRQLADLLEGLAVDELVIVGHSMGGLVTRSALHQASVTGHRWPGRLTKVVFLGTPHHGAPLERAGSWVDVLLGTTPYSAPISRLGKVRSAGITDLRHGSLLHEDWEGRDRFQRTPRRPRVVPLPEGVAFFAVAGTRGAPTGEDGERVRSDGLVPVPSALGDHGDPSRSLGIPESRRWVAPSTGHLDLLWRPEVWERVRGWLGEV